MCKIAHRCGFRGENAGKISCMAKGKKKRREAAPGKRVGADPYVATLLSGITAGKQELTFRKNEKIFRQGELAEKFMASLLTRNIDLEEDLCDQLFNHSEKRLARVLLKLARLREPDVVPDASVPVLSHETLAEMVGTTRSRITHFMNKFRTMGLIGYNGELTVRTELLTDLVLHD